MACAIEDAGFEIRDMIEWVYGCLSEDTEILTINGWERYHKNIVDNPVLCYNPKKNSFEFHKPLRDYFYENKHTAYRIKSDKTDQIVSRNHRVLVEREGKLLFQYAEEVAQEQETSIPILESLSDLPDIIPNFYKGTSITKQDLFKRVSDKDIGISKETGSKISHYQEVFSMWQRISNKTKQTIQVLFQEVQRKNKRNKFNSKQVRQDGDEVSRNGIKGRKKSSLERWSNLFQKTWELFANKICQVSARIFRDGSERWLCYGTSFNNGSIAWQKFGTNRSSTSYQSQSTGQQDRKFTAIQDQPRTQNSRRTKATITPIKYKGNVWCVEVPTGAFIARRNGMIFITGNSGFPKSLDILKAIDKIKPRLGKFDKFAKHLSNQIKAKGISQKEISKHFLSKTGG